MKSMLCVAALLFALVVPGPAEAADRVGADEPPTHAVQNRIHPLRHEYTLWGGALPLDAFTKGVTLSGAYTVHFNHLLAWEVGQFTWSFGVDTRLKDELANLPQPVGVTPFEVVRYYATSNVIFTPLYGKSAVLNRGLIRHEGFILAGAGVGWMTLSVRPVVDVGVGWRVFAGKHVSFRAELRDLLFIDTADVHNELWLGVGLSVGIGK